MSQHPSLRSKEKNKKHRSVLKRYECVKELKEKEKWQEGDSIFGLPKLKIVQFKIKKEKAAPKEGAQPADGAAATPQAPDAKVSAQKPAPEKKAEGKKQAGK